MDEFLNTRKLPGNIFYQIYKKPDTTYHSVSVNKINYQRQPLRMYTCHDPANGGLDDLSASLELFSEKEPDILPIRNNSIINKSSLPKNVNSSTQSKHHDHEYDDDTIAHTWQDGSYLFIMCTEGDTDFTDTAYSLNVTV